jgi:hypothetical protein
VDKKLDDLHLDTWRLFITANARLLDIIDGDLLAAGCLPLHWYDVLVELAQAPERRLRMSELAERVVLSRSGLTRLVDRLEAEEFLVRERSAETWGIRCADRKRSGGNAPFVENLCTGDSSAFCGTS